MVCAIAGDIIGSIYEAHPIKTKAFLLFHPACRFAEDSVLTIAIAQAILGNKDYGPTQWEMVRISSNPILLPRIPFGKHKGLPFQEVPPDFLGWLLNTVLDEGMEYTVNSHLGRFPSYG